MKNKKKHLLHLVATPSVLLSSFMGVSASAQDGPMEEILVTAQFREQRLQDTPIAITALSGSEIDNKALNSIIDIAATAPNVNIAAGSGAYGSGAAVYIRGVGQYDTNFAFEPGVGVYVDDVYHGVMAGGVFDLLDLDRVEILRGPQGTLAGRNSIGGAVKLYSLTPEGSNEGYFSVTGGNFERLDLRGAYDFALTDNLNMRVSGFSKNRDGHVDLVDFACDQPALAGTLPNNALSIDSCVTGSLGGIQSTGGRVVLGWEPRDDLSVTVSGMWVKDESEAAGTELTYADRTTLAFGPPVTAEGVTFSSIFIPTSKYVSYSTFSDTVGATATGLTLDPLATTEMKSVSGRVVWDISNNLQLTSITAFTDMESEWTLDNDGSPLTISLTRNLSPYEQFTQELRLNGSFVDANVDWTIGGYYFDSTGNVAARVVNLGFLQDDPVDSTSTAIFAHGVWSPTDSLNFTAGVRYTEDEKTYDFVRRDPTGAVAAPPFGFIHGASGSYEGDQVDWRLGADYRFNDEVLAYANFSTGYKGGGINPRPFVPSQIVPFDPETVEAFEVGVKTDLFNNTLRINAAYFMNDYKDVILVDANGFPGSPGDADYFFLSAAPFNAGDADISGYEVEVFYEPGNGLSISGSLSYLDFEYKDLDPNATASGIGSDFVAPFTPEWKYSIQASYEFELDGGATITPRIYANFTDSVYTDPVNAPNNLLDDYKVVNANVTYRTAGGDWVLVGGVTNLTDEHYHTNAFDVSGINGTTQKGVARPQEWFVTARRNF